MKKLYINQEEFSSPEIQKNEYSSSDQQEDFNFAKNEDRAFENLSYELFSQESGILHSSQQSSKNSRINDNGDYFTDLDSQDYMNNYQKKPFFTAHNELQQLNSHFSNGIDEQNKWINHHNNNYNIANQSNSLQIFANEIGNVVKNKPESNGYQPFTIKRVKQEDNLQNSVESSAGDTSYNSLKVYFSEKKKQNNQIDQEKNQKNNKIFEEDQPEEGKSDFHFFNKKEYENKKKQYMIDKKREKEENKKKEEQALVILKQKRKFKPIRIQQKAEYKQSLYNMIDEQQNFLFFGDFCVCKDVFRDIETEKMKTSCCPINYFRPPVQVIKGTNYCLAQLDDTYHGILDVTNACQMLESLQCYEAKIISDFLVNKYKKQLDGQIEFRKQVLAYYKNNEQKIREIIAQNHALSLKKALDIISKLDQNKVIAIHYKKIDHYTLTTKQHFVGGNSAFCNLFIGSQNIDMMSQFMSRWGLPHYMDARGIVDLSRVIFEGGTSFRMSMVTYDDFEIPLTTTIKRINLNSFEIMPGFSLCDILEVRVLEGNKNLLENVHRQRYLSPQSVIEKFKLDDFHYTIEAEQFINKYYTTS